MYVIPAGKTRKFAVQIKLDDATLVNPDSVEFFLDDKQNFEITIEPRDAYISVVKDTPPNIQTHLLIKAKYTHAHHTYTYFDDVYIVTGHETVIAPAATDVVSLAVTVGAPT